MNRRALSPSDLQPKYLVLSCLALGAFYLFYASSLVWTWVPEGCSARRESSHPDVLPSSHPSSSPPDRVLEHTGPISSFRGAYLRSLLAWMYYDALFIARELEKGHLLYHIVGNGWHE